MTNLTGPLEKENRRLHRQLEALQVKHLSQRNQISALRSELSKLLREHEALKKQKQGGVVIVPAKVPHT
jgi:chromosome segregation ATPase